jgi:glycerophosphoryl diester phosphodiesterase
MAGRGRLGKRSKAVATAAKAAAREPVDAYTRELLSRRPATGVDLVTPMKVRTPIYLAHRGAHLLYPENSLEGLRATGLAGFAGECDVRILSDGNLALCHDASTAATMTGSPADLSTLDRKEWKVRRVLPQVPNGQKAVPALWDDVVTELGGRMVLAPELKDRLPPTRDAVIASILSRNLERAVIVQSFKYDDMLATASAGIASLYLSDSADPSVLVADGIEFVGCSTEAPKSYIDALTALGILPIVYTVNTRAGWERAVVMDGAAGVFSDDPWHVSRQFADRSSDPFQMRDSWPHFVGACASRVWEGDDLARIWHYGPPRGLRRVNLDAPYDEPLSLDAGWAGQQRGPGVRVRMTVTFLERATQQSSWVGMYLGTLANEDEVFRYGAAAGQNGYHAFLERSGRFAIQGVGDGVAPADLVTSDTPAAPAALPSARSQPMRIELVIDATGVTLTNLTTDVSASIEHTEYRGPCRLNLTNYGTEAEYEDIGIEDLA